MSGSFLKSSLLKGTEEVFFSPLSTRFGATGAAAVAGAGAALGATGLGAGATATG